MKKRKSLLESNVLYTVIAIIIGFVIGAIFLAAAGISPAEAYGKLLNGVFGKTPDWLNILLFFLSTSLQENQDNDSHYL